MLAECQHRVVHIPGRTNPTDAGDPGSNPALGKHGYVTTRSSSPGQPRRSPMLTFATKTHSTGANGQKVDGTSPFVRAVLKKLSWPPGAAYSDAATGRATGTWHHHVTRMIVPGQCQVSLSDKSDGTQAGGALTLSESRARAESRSLPVSASDARR